MLPSARAVVFDMDDTIYPYRRYVASGFNAVARHVERVHGANRRDVRRLLAAASRGPGRGREFQYCVAVLGLEPAAVRSLLRVFATHPLALRLPPTVARVLTALRGDGWRLGVLTNGPADVQRRKVAALNLAHHVDAVVFATEHGSGAGKPERATFDTVLGRLGVRPEHAVFVGDDDRCDIQGATDAGLHPVRCHAWTRPAARAAARATIDRWTDIPLLARVLLEETVTSHVA